MTETGGIIFDIEQCFTDGHSGSIALGVTRLDDLAQAHAPLFDNRASRVADGAAGNPFLCYGGDRERMYVFDMHRDGLVTGIHVDLRGADILDRRFYLPHFDDAGLNCGPFRIRMNAKPVERWATLVDALASGAVESARPVALSGDAGDHLRILNLDWTRDGRRLHLAFEPRMIHMRHSHACQARFDYCIERVRLFALKAES